jgi:hypothetical protein
LRCSYWRSWSSSIATTSTTYTALASRWPPFGTDFRCISGSCSGPTSTTA